MIGNNQKIKCTVKSCQFNNCEQKLCELQQIHVDACPGVSNGEPKDESMCGSYKYKG